MSFVLTGFADEISNDPDEQIETLIQAKINYLELRGVNGRNILEINDDQALDFKSKLDKANLSVSSIGSPIGKVQIRSDLTNHMNHFRIALQRAKMFRTPYVRVFSFYHEGINPDLCRGEIITFFKQMVYEAHIAKCIILHENERNIYGETPARCLDLVETLNSPRLRLAFDPANFVQAGIRPLIDAWPNLKHHTEYFHIKDALAKNGRVVPAGHGDGDLAKILQQATANNFNGFLSIEPHLKADDPDYGGSGPERFLTAVRALRSLLEQIGSIESFEKPPLKDHE